MAAALWIAFDPVLRSNRFEALKVKTIVTGGAMDVHYGLLRNDVIIGVASVVGLVTDTVGAPGGTVSTTMAREAGTSIAAPSAWSTRPANRAYS